MRDFHHFSRKGHLHFIKCRLVLREGAMSGLEQVPCNLLEQVPCNLLEQVPCNLLEHVPLHGVGHMLLESVPCLILKSILCMMAAHVRIFTYHNSITSCTSVFPNFFWIMPDLNASKILIPPARVREVLFSLTPQNNSQPSYEKIII